VSSVDNSINTFLALLRAGLWGGADTNLHANGNLFEGVEWEKIYQLAQEQSVQGIVLQGIEAVQGAWLKVHGSPLVPRILLLQWIGEVQVIEQRNKEMNAFIADLIEKLRKADIYALLVKGQGIAQCYEKPLWRCSGDVDLLLDKENYRKAITCVLPISSSNNPEGHYSKHKSFVVQRWSVELHGSLRTGLSTRVDRLIDHVQARSIHNREVRVWHDGAIPVHLPGIDNDVVFIFTHYLMHFYRETLGLKQICDWCRLLWTYRDSLNYELLEQRIKRAGLMSEWLGFATFAVDYLSMPFEAMPLYDSISKKDKERGKQLMEFILCGYSGSKLKNTISITKIFPWKTLRYSPSIFLNVNWMKVKERVFGDSSR
jgi:hypothetical protein